MEKGHKLCECNCGSLVSKYEYLGKYFNSCMGRHLNIESLLNVSNTCFSFNVRVSI